MLTTVIVTQQNYRKISDNCTTTAADIMEKKQAISATICKWMIKNWWC